MYNGIENITICDHPLLKHKLSILRNKTTGTNEFRIIVEEIAMLIGYEALRDLEVEYAPVGLADIGLDEMGVSVLWLSRLTDDDIKQGFHGS